MVVALQFGMPRKKLLRSDSFPYHVTSRTNNREPFPLALKFVWKIATEELYLLGLTYEIEVHAFVLMPNHLHLLLTVPEEDLGKVMSLFLTAFTKRVNALSGRTGHLFGGPYFWSMITSTRYFGHVLKYVNRNPIKAGLSERVEEYEFGTACGAFGARALPFPLHFTRIGLEINLPDGDNPLAWLNWLNTPFPSETEKMIQKMMKRKIIKEMVSRTTRRPLRELNCLV